MANTLTAAVLNGIKPATPELGALMVGFDAMITALKPGITRNEFGIVIGDDTTGRIPALIVHRTINAWNRAHGLPSIPIVFIQGASSDNQVPALERAIANRQQYLDARDPAKRALVVTEGITTGQAIARLGRILTRQGIPFDVAALDGSRFRRDQEDANRNLVSRKEVNLLISRMKLAPSWTVFRENPECRRLRDVLARYIVDETSLLAFRAKFEAGTLTETELVSALERWRKCPLVTSRPPAVQMDLVRDVYLASNAKSLGKKVWNVTIALLEGYDFTSTQFESARKILTRFEASQPTKFWYSPLSELRKGAVPLRSSRARKDPLVDAAGWPRATRLYCGNVNAGPIRDRKDFTGLTTEKFSTAPLYVGTRKEREKLRTVRMDVRSIGEWEAARMEFASVAVPAAVPAVHQLITELGDQIVAGSYRFLMVPAAQVDPASELFAAAVNRALVERGMKRLPVLHLDGADVPHSPRQIEEFNRQSAKLKRLPRGSRGLVMCANQHLLSTAASILERVNDAGLAADVVCAEQVSKDHVNHYQTAGIWRPGTRLMSGGPARLVDVGEPESRLRKDIRFIAPSLASGIG